MTGVANITRQPTPTVSLVFNRMSSSRRGCAERARQVQPYSEYSSPRRVCSMACRI
jgi:hypothetical protein